MSIILIKAKNITKWELGFLIRVSQGIQLDLL